MLASAPTPAAGLELVKSQGGPALLVTKTAGQEPVVLIKRDPDPGYEPAMIITRAGLVGFGTANPAAELHVVGSICYTGGVAACSDHRYKIDLQPIDSALEKITRIHGQYYFWNRTDFPGKKFSEQRQIGLLAQDVEQYFPEIVHTDADGYKSVDYSRLTPVLIEALKAQQLQIERLNARLEKLEQMEARLEVVEQLLRRDGSE